MVEPQILWLKSREAQGPLGLTAVDDTDLEHLAAGRAWLASEESLGVPMFKGNVVSCHGL